MVDVVRESGAGVVLMHMQGTPETMQQNPTYADVVAEVRDFLAERVRAFVAAGVPAERIAVDPGIGFGKTFDHNLALLRELGRVARPRPAGGARRVAEGVPRPDHGPGSRGTAGVVAGGGVLLCVAGHRSDSARSRRGGDGGRGEGDWGD